MRLNQKRNKINNITFILDRKANYIYVITELTWTHKLRDITYISNRFFLYGLVENLVLGKNQE